MNEGLDKTSEKLEKPLRDENGRLLPNQQSLNPNGRPKGSLSVIGKLKQIWEDNPEDFERFVDEYRKDPQSRKHITEMIDGKPNQPMELKGDLTINLVKYDDNNNPTSV